MPVGAVICRSNSDFVVVDAAAVVVAAVDADVGDGPVVVVVIDVSALSSAGDLQLSPCGSIGRSHHTLPRYVGHDHAVGAGQQLIMTV